MNLKNKFNSWEVRMMRKEKLKVIKAEQNQLIEAVKEEKARERRRRLQKRKQKEENERKAEVVQVVSFLFSFFLAE
jgi:hypothetical protein